VATLLHPGSYDHVVRKVMLALEFVDPLSGMPVTRGLKVTVQGLGAPQRVTAARFIWLLKGEPAAQDIVVEAVSTDLRFRDLTATIAVPANDGETKPAALRKPLLLEPTGLNLPPAGMTSVGGMLIDDNDPPGGIADAKVTIQLRDIGTQTFTASYTAVSDPRGGFVAAAPDFHKAAPTPAPPPVPGGPPAPEGSVVGWLEIRKGGVTHYTAPLALRPGRLLRLPAPLQLSTLSQAPPP
jgi:hypothetical protein